MPKEITKKEGTQVLFNVAATYNPATALSDIEVGTPTDVAWTPTGLTTGQARASTKADLGANRAAAYSVIAAIEFSTAPVAGETCDFYWAPSAVSTAGTGNPGNVSGTDADYTGSPATLAEGLAQLMFIGSLFLTVDANIQVAEIGILYPPTRYGMMVMHNNTSDTTGDNVETAIALDPIIDEIA